jgi:homoserine O-succinyltransferase
VPTTLLSCLASHASILLFDGIDRVARPVKCSGVFAGTVEDPFDPLATGLPQVVRIPHSRLNDVPEPALLEAGYRIVVGSGSSGAGWAIAAREQGDSLFVLCQGHPEYGTLSLLREYRRDVRRSLFGRGAVAYPRLPEGYVCGEAADKLAEFELRAQRGDADPRELWAAFPFEEVAATVENTWAPASSILYANWLKLAQAAVPIRV